MEGDRSGQDQSAFVLLDEARRQVEQQLSCSILHDRQVSEEAIMFATHGFGSISGISRPNHFKIAGHLAFWIRKLKPFRIFRFSTFVAYLDQKGLPHQFPETLLKQENSGNPNNLYINEIIAVKVAFGFIHSAGITLKPKPELVHDLIISLRYHSFSPNAVRIILEGMAEIPNAAPVE